MTNEDNITIFEDTADTCANSARLKESIKKSRAEQLFIKESAAVADGSLLARFKDEARIVVSKKRTFEAAQQYAFGADKVCVLNFASASNPGGGVKNGARAQEECLCRCSTLYFCLDTDENWERFYKPHRKSHNPLHNDDILYTPAVMVFKSDTAYPRTMPERDWYGVDVITCAAPNLRPQPSNRYNSGDGNTPLLLTDEQLSALHAQRDKRIFDVAVQQGVDVLVLGAFGCGAFRNSPQVVADVLLRLADQYKHAFKVIEFAVFCPPHDDSNYRAFCEQK